jgi:hypothetical protein
MQRSLAIHRDDVPGWLVLVGGGWRYWLMVGGYMFIVCVVVSVAAQGIAITGVINLLYR